MTSTIPRLRRMRLAASALLLVAAVPLAGCATGSAAPPSPDSTPREQPIEAEYVYEDAVAGYSVTFPEEPDVRSRADPSGGTLTMASLVEDSSDGMSYMSQGIVELQFEMSDLPMFLINSARASGAVVDDGEITGVEIEGLPGFQAAVTMADGTPGSVLVAGDPDRGIAYQLAVAGGDLATRQAFIDSFRLLDAP